MRSRSAGIALVVYAVATVVGGTGMGLPGGDYEAGKVTGFLAWDHFWVASVFAYVTLLGAVALLPFARGLRGMVGGRGDAVWGLGVAAVAVGVVGTFLGAGIAVAAAEGGPAVRDALPLPVVHALGEVAGLVAACGTALLVGLIALAVAASTAFPTWVRIGSGVAALCGVLAPFYLTYFLFLLWMLVLGIWLATAGRRVTSEDPLPSLV